MKRIARKLIPLLALAAFVFAPRACQARTPSSTSRPSFPLLGCGTAVTSLQSEGSASAGAIPLGLAMADFTGDGNPDLATVELDRLNPSSAQYLIEIRLTEGGRQSLMLSAPVGDLLVTPQDVTGDGTLDLVVHTSQSSAPIAIFVNDGCGHFSEASKSAALVQVREDAPSEFHLRTDRPYVGGSVIASGSYTVQCHSESLDHPQVQKSVLPCGRCGSAFHSFLAFGSNRAPPAVA